MQYTLNLLILHNNIMSHIDNLDTNLTENVEYKKVVYGLEVM